MSIPATLPDDERGEMRASNAHGSLGVRRSRLRYATHRAELRRSGLSDGRRSERTNDDRDPSAVG